MEQNSRILIADEQDRCARVALSDTELTDIENDAARKGIDISQYIVEACKAYRSVEAAYAECERRPIVEELIAIRSGIWYLRSEVGGIAHGLARGAFSSLLVEDAVAMLLKSYERLAFAVSEVLQKVD